MASLWPVCQPWGPRCSPGHSLTGSLRADAPELAPVSAWPPGLGLSSSFRSPCGGRWREAACTRLGGLSRLRGTAVCGCPGRASPSRRLLTVPVGPASSGLWEAWGGASVRFGPSRCPLCLEVGKVRVRADAPGGPPTWGGGRTRSTRCSAPLHVGPRRARGQVLAAHVPGARVPPPADEFAGQTRPHAGVRTPSNRIRPAVLGAPRRTDGSARSVFHPVFV